MVAMAAGVQPIITGKLIPIGKLMTIDKFTLPKKSLGQHWLHDSGVLEAMCIAADVNKNDVVLEIGPGTGTLTTVLAKRVKQVIAIELDKRLAQELENSVQDNVRIIQQDILKFDLTSLPKGYKVVANIPYYLTSNLIRVLSESLNPPALVALLVQKEVAERVAAKPGSMSILSVATQFYYEILLGQVVPAELFTPPPKVDSQILVLKWRPEPLFPGIDTKQFFKLVKAGFAQRRKTLTNSISGGLRISTSQATELLKNAGISPSARAQTLALEQWYELYEKSTPLLRN